MKRLMLVFAGVTLLDMLVICFAAKPFPWVAIIPGLIPLFIVALVIIPLKKSQVS
ncbi:MAG: hypothetical protein M3R43_08540 [Acidobacteriota bacterium]|nr:hypothetical protein [Acidobacteriota bacterium]